MCKMIFTPAKNVGKNAPKSFSLAINAHAAPIVLMSG